MSMKRVVVISRRGKLVGAWVPPSGAVESNAPRASVVAGPGQRLHEIELESLESVVERRAVAELHKLIRRKLKLK